MKPLKNSGVKCAALFVALVAAVFTASAVIGRANAQTFPDPSDEAALYEGAKKEGTVVWYGSGPLENMKALGDEFEKKYPGVKVEILRIVGTAQYQRFMQETQAKQYIADILHIADEPSMEDLINRGYVADWKVPTHDRIAADARIKTNAYAAYFVDDLVVYNTNKVTPEEVKILSASWDGLIDPRFKGRIAATDQKCGTCYGAVHMFLDPKYQNKWGWPFLQKLAAQKLKVYNDIVTIVDRVVAGEQDIGIWQSESGGSPAKWKDGAPIHWIHVAPTPAWGSTIQGISKFAPHPYAARLFQNWSMSEDGARAIQTRTGAATTLTGFPDQRPFTKEPWYTPITERYVPDNDRWSRDYDKDMDKWAAMMKEGSR